MAAPAIGMRPPVSGKHGHGDACPIELAIRAGGYNCGEAQRLRGQLASGSIFFFSMKPEGCVFKREREDRAEGSVGRARPVPL